MVRVLWAVLLSVGLSCVAMAEETKPRVLLETSLGSITLELDQQKAPVSVGNFIQYVNDGFYDGTIFHRVIDRFMIQGGGFSKGMNQKSTRAPIKNEGGNGLMNQRGTIAMARTSRPDSATSQFFINLKDNDFLNREDPRSDGVGYAVFGQVVEGMEVVDKIRTVATGVKKGHRDVPVEDVLLIKASIIQ